MSAPLPFRCRAGRLAVLTAGLALALAPSAAWSLGPQASEPAATAVLLGRARTLEERGRLDLARQAWLEVLATSPGDAEALAGLVRAARAAHQPTEAAQYLGRLRAAHPQSPELARLETENGQPAAVGHNQDLDEADRLARAGDASGALAVYRRVYGATPPAGEPALRFYAAEGALPEQRPEAVAALRALADRYPDDHRYSVALGRLLLESPRTRAEGRTLLESYPADPVAVSALRSTPEREASPVARPSAAHALVVSPPVGAAGGGTPAAAPVGVTARHPGSTAGEEQAGYTALNAHDLPGAETIFRGVLARDAGDARALAGLGYVAAGRGDLKAATLFFEQAQEHGDHSLALTRALVNAQFNLGLQQARALQTSGDLAGAQQRFTDALRERPNDPEALDGQGDLLLRQGLFAAAAPVFERLTHARPLSPAAWRGLVLADTGSERPAEAIAADAHVPAEVRPSLAADGPYQQALAKDRSVTVVQVAPSPVTTTVTAKVPPVRPPAPATPAAATSPSGTGGAVARTESKPPLTARPAASSQPEAAESSGPPAPTRARRHPRPGQLLAGTTVAVTPAPPAVGPSPPSIPPEVAVAAERVAQGNAVLQGGDGLRAATLFRDALQHRPEDPAGWRGLILALHAAGRESDAAAAYRTAPPAAEAVLERDATLQQAAGAALLAADRPSAALEAWARAQAIFSAQRLQPPAALALGLARLLAEQGAEGNLYRQLMYLGSRPDLSEAQRRELQGIWTRWAVRRARTLADGGDQPAALTVLNAAAEAFAGNREVLAAVAAGYVGVGLPRQAVVLYKAEDPTRDPAPGLLRAIRAGIAARDFKAAEGWLRNGRAQFPADPGFLTAAAELEQARGHRERAAELAGQARTLAVAQDPGEVLVAALREAPQQPLLATNGRLAMLLVPDAALTAPSGGQPYLPGAPAGERPGETAPVLVGVDGGTATNSALVGQGERLQ